MTLIEFDKVSKIYKMGSDEIRALDKISLSIDKGEFTVILRPSGSLTRSEERRVGKECRSRWSPYH